MSRQKLRIAVPVVAVAALVGGAASGLTATLGHKAPSARQATYSVTAALKGAGGYGSFSGTITKSGSRGTLTWHVTYKPDTGSQSAQIRAGGGFGGLLLRLCGPCPVAAHGTRSIAGAALTGVLAGHAGVLVSTKHGALRGAIRARAKSTGGGGGGTLVINPTPALVAQGKALAAQHSCGGCHTIDGQKSAGPTWKGLAGSKVHQTDGTTITATDAYLVRVITDPTTLKVVGYDPSLMASYIPPGSISRSQAIALVAYIKTIK
jgi:mono/diheme cytochrome c family protein